MPPSTLSPAITLLQQYLSVSGDLQPARCTPWFKDGWRVSGDVMLHAEAILRASYSAAPTFITQNPFLLYAVDLRDRNSIWECFAVLAGAYYTQGTADSQDEYYAELAAAYTDNSLYTLLAGTTAVAQLMAHGDGDERGHLLLSYLATSPALFRWTGLTLAIARSQPRLVALVSKVLDDGEQLSIRDLHKVDRKLQAAAKGSSAEAVAPAAEQEEKAAALEPQPEPMQQVQAPDSESEQKMDVDDGAGAEAEDGQDGEDAGADDEDGQDGQDGQDADSHSEDTNDAEGSDDADAEDGDYDQDEKAEEASEDDGPTVRLTRKRSLAIVVSSVKRVCLPSNATPTPTPRSKPGFCFTQTGGRRETRSFNHKLGRLREQVPQQLRGLHDAQWWRRQVRSLQRSEPSRWRYVVHGLMHTASEQLATVRGRKMLDSVYALCSAVVDMHSEELKLWDLCCGTGAFSVAFQQACEALKLAGATFLSLDNEKRCIAAVQKNQLSDNAVVFDIHAFDFSTAPTADIVSCGIPCPKYSQMSQFPLGTTDDDPIHALFKLASGPSRPRAFVLECVDGMKTRHPEDFAALLQSFEGAGYHCWHAIYNSADFGLAQERKRLFMAFFREQVDWERFQPPEAPGPDEKVDFRTILLEPHEDDPCWIPHLETTRFPGTDKGLYGDEPVSVRDAQRPGEMYNHDQQHPGDEWRRCETTAPCLLKSWDHPSNRPVILDGDNWRLLKSRELARLQGFPEWYGWPDLRDQRERRDENRAFFGSSGKVGKGLTQENAECGMLGNAVSIPVAQAVMRAVLQAFALPEPEAMDDVGGL